MSPRSSRPRRKASRSRSSAIAGPRASRQCRFSIPKARGCGDEEAPMPTIHLTYLGGPEIEKLALTDDELLTATEDVIRAQGSGQTVIEPRVHLVPDPKTIHGHFNVLRGYVAPLGVAGVKIVSDYVDNYKHGLRSEMALLNLFHPATGMPVAVIGACDITDMRTG